MTEPGLTVHVGRAGSYPAPEPYARAGNLFDVVSGTNGTCAPSVICHAGVCGGQVLVYRSRIQLAGWLR